MYRVDKCTLKQIEQLNKRIGQKVWYRGSWGHDEPELATFEGAEFDDDRNDVVVDVTCDDGDTHWGYAYQIKFIEEK